MDIGKKEIYKSSFLKFFKMRPHKGFTLIELLVVISIIGFLTTMAIYAINVAREKAKIAEAKDMVGKLHKIILINLGLTHLVIFKSFSGFLAKIR